VVHLEQSPECAPRLSSLALCYAGRRFGTSVPPGKSIRERLLELVLRESHARLSVLRALRLEVRLRGEDAYRTGARAHPTDCCEQVGTLWCSFSG
jgi:hypothetical protein